jgi:hypothetical protein
MFFERTLIVTHVLSKTRDCESRCDKHISSFHEYSLTLLVIRLIHIGSVVIYEQRNKNTALNEIHNETVVSKGK